MPAPRGDRPQSMGPTGVLGPCAGRCAACAPTYRPHRHSRPLDPDPYAVGPGYFYGPLSDLDHMTLHVGCVWVT